MVTVSIIRQWDGSKTATHTLSLSLERERVAVLARVRILPEAAHFSIGKVTVLGVLRCFALLFV